MSRTTLLNAISKTEKNPVAILRLPSMTLLGVISYDLFRRERNIRRYYKGMAREASAGDDYFVASLERKKSL